MDNDLNTLRQQLRQAVSECSLRGLLVSAKWAAEQLCSLPASETPATPASRWAQQDTVDADRLSLAKCLFDTREFERVQFYLQDCRGPRARFLRLYSRFLNHERQPAPVHSEPIQDLDLDAFGMYLLAAVYKQQGQKEMARAMCLQSLHQFEYNWSCWLLLESCVDVRQPLEKLSSELPSGWMRHAFLSHLLLDLFSAGTVEFDMHYQALERVIPQSLFVLGLRAVRYYNQRDFEQASQVFGELQQVDPYRLDLSDIHSNILYVMEDKARLGSLAHRCAALDRFRPETCCVIGNYYSLRRENEKAVGYFQRALQLDRNYLAAWTLMGHEYMEMKNTAAAVDAYRHAVDVDERDYRAWHGLGQTYELLKMPHYAINYYMRAAALRPYDSRMWRALANCYEQSGQAVRAIDCYKRALIGTSEDELLSISRLAKLYVQTEDRKSAAYYYQLAYENSSAQRPDELATACLFLADFEQARGNTSAARQYLAEVVESGAGVQQVEEAKAMMRAMASSGRQ
ncbi:TPR-like protein [Linderina pennispora]|uniref:TPR-like protein n=1 Tax=Linderina pennispora TaxID=61395 RepID=A0A1Y1WKL3_9FUNG|nr:TPR-like protein [Linderina pennispora]ORX74087.1 TPR-like protein [Linderina pennispora]